MKLKSEDLIELCILNERLGICFPNGRVSCSHDAKIAYDSWKKPGGDNSVVKFTKEVANMTNFL